MQQQFDYIVVGGGSAGCVAAYRLAKNSSARILLLESGSWDRNPLIKLPIGFAKMMGEGAHNWNYMTEPEPGLEQRRLPLPRGRVMGGCSAINGMVYIRGQREDYDGWARRGNEGWSYDDVLPLFRRSERYWGGASHYHGVDGLLEVSQVRKRLPVSDAFIEAAVQAGIPANADFNGASQEGVGYFDANIRNGKRLTSSSAFLEKRAIPDNLTVLTGFDVHRIEFEGTRAAGVTGVRRGRDTSIIRFGADCEVILSAGAFNTPKLLELSGVGDATRLRSLGIEVRADLPGVGENLQDHCNNYLYFSARDCASYSDYVKPWRAPITLLHYLVNRGGIFANPAAIAGAFLKVDEGAARPDAQIHFAAGAAAPDEAGRLQPVSGVCASICRLQPQSVGAVHITSADVDSAPAIMGAYLQAESDRRFQLRAVGRLREIFAQPALASLLGPELPPLAGCESESDLLAGICQHAESVHHPVGTCRMGVDSSAVVTPRLDVIGIDGLRVADASVMPRLISGNTHAASVMIGEKLAELVLSR